MYVLIEVTLECGFVFTIVYFFSYQPVLNTLDKNSLKFTSFRKSSATVFYAGYIKLIFKFQGPFVCILFLLLFLHV